MGILFVIFFLTASGWMLTALFRRLRRQHVSRSLWFAFSGLAACGIAAGVWCACFVEYHLGTHFRIGSFPIPVVFFHFEDNQWVDFPVPPVQAWLAIATNIITITALATLPVWLLLRRHDHVA